MILDVKQNKNYIQKCIFRNKSDLMWTPITFRVVLCHMKEMPFIILAFRES